MKFEQHKNYFFELDVKWFEENYEANSKNYPNDLYVDFINEIIKSLKINTNNGKQVRLNIQCGASIQLLIDASKNSTKDILFYDLDNNVWKHRYTFMIRPLTEQGVKLLNKTYSKKIQKSKSFVEINNNIQLVGEIYEDEEQCSTCMIRK